MLIHSFVDIGEEVKIDVDIVLVSILANGENMSHNSERQLFGRKILIFDIVVQHDQSGISMLPISCLIPTRVM